MQYNKLRYKFILKIISVVFILAIAFQLVNKTFYTHTHVLANGKVVTHSHPYNKSNDQAPVKTHHHTTFDITVIEQVNLLFLIIFIVLAIIIAKPLIFYTALKQILYIYYFKFTYTGRAPPA